MKEEIFQAVNKFIFFTWNYKMCMAISHTPCGNERKALVPEFVAKAKWTFGVDHAINKWMQIENTVSTNMVMDFYKDLDNTNRKIFVDWVMDNYKG